ncbi:MAG: hypothetical protein OEZ51_05490 [Nitrospinota bacterium]|nr:hypothetical protein [Nitrospinota bacterium]
MKKLRVGGIDFTKKYVCMECGCQRDPIDAKRGLLVIEIFMWLLYILPGVIYSIWRRVRKQQICPNCRNPSVVLTSSSRAMAMMRMMKTFTQPQMANSKNTQTDLPSKPSSGKPVQSQNQKTGKKDLDAILKSSSRRGLKPKGQQGLIDFKTPNQGK